MRLSKLSVILSVIIVGSILLALVVKRVTKTYGPVELGSHVEVTHGFYSWCTGEVVEVDDKGSYWIEAVCDGEDRGRLRFSKDFLRRTR